MEDVLLSNLTAEGSALLLVNLKQRLFFAYHEEAIIPHPQLQVWLLTGTLDHVTAGRDVVSLKMETRVSVDFRRGSLQIKYQKNNICFILEKH